jgi:DNA-binding beta-propeller fold protein YncE
MSSRHLGYIELPEHLGSGGFDHAAVDRPRGLLYVAHTANDAVDVIDIRSNRYLRSVTGLTGVAGALVHEPSGQVFTSNRGENTLGMFSADSIDRVTKVPVGLRPNGLAYDPERGLVLCANVGDPGVPGSHTVTLVDAREPSVIATIPVPGRTRWAIHDAEQGVFFVNIADPPLIAVIAAGEPTRIARTIAIPARGPHGLDLDRARERLYCACDDATLVSIDSGSGAIGRTLELGGAPDVVFFDAALSRLYVAIGDPGLIDVIDVAAWRRVEAVVTEPGAHTLALDESAHRIYAFLPRSHRASVIQDAMA